MPGWRPWWWYRGALGQSRGLVLPGDHGCVGDMVAGLWRSVAVSIGRGENLIYLRSGGGEARSLLEGVVAAIIARRVAPGETMTLGSGGGGAPVSYPSFLKAPSWSTQFVVCSFISSR